MRKITPTKEGWSQMMHMMGGRTFDYDRYWETEDCRWFTDAYDFFLNKEPSREEMRSYWQQYEKGLICTYHGNRETPEDYWASYVPLSAGDGKRKYPMILLLHGSNNEIEMAQCYGILQLAAREEIITIVPTNENEDYLLKLIGHAIKEYPVDVSRIYAVGFSMGAFRCSAMGIQHPELFAGLGLGGMVSAGEVKAFTDLGVSYPDITLTQAQIDRAAALNMAICLIVGEEEFIDLIPLYHEDYVLPGIQVDLSAGKKYQTIQLYREMGGCKRTCPESYTEETLRDADEVTRRLGFPFERREIRQYNGRAYYVGDSTDADGNCRFRMIGVEGQLHLPSLAFPGLVWEHISRFSRDPVTHKLQDLPQEVTGCGGE